LVRRSRSISFAATSTTGRRRWCRLRASIGFLAVALAVMVTPELGDAHAVLVRSNPASRSTLSHPAGRVDLWFSEALEPAFSTVSVWSAAGAQVDRRDGAVSLADPKRLSVTLGALGPGAYTVRFRVLSVDGHVVEASFSFRVKAP
jgi:copper resistance protein C